jgi:hypothetical protein
VGLVCVLGRGGGAECLGLGGGVAGGAWMCVFGPGGGVLSGWVGGAVYGCVGG